MEDMETPKRRRRKVPDIPNSLLVDIFSRLPIVTLLHCRRVCKAWYSCLSSLEFANAYQSKPPYISLLHCNLSAQYHLVEFMDDYDNSHSPRRLGIPPQLSRRDTKLVGSCNGIVCFLKCCRVICNCEEDLDLFIGNPVLGEYYLLPRPNLKHKMGDIHHETYGFGFNPNTGHYKVLRVLQLEGGNRKNAEIQVLTVGVDEDWRVLGYNVPTPQPIGGRYGRGYKHRVCEFITFAGAIHWMNEDEETQDFIYSFDIAEERVRPLPPPPFDFKDRDRKKCLTVFRDSFCVVTFDFSHVAIWSMKQYGVSESWSKEIFWRIFIGNLSFELYPIGIWRNGEMLFRTRLYSLFSYCPIRKQYEVLRTDSRISQCDTAISYVPSFLHLEDAINTTKAKTIRGKLTTINKLKRIETGALRKHRDAITSIADLPSYILMEIFSKLPIGTVSSSMCVSKSWYHFISEPAFARAYFTNQTFVDVVIFNHNSVCRFLELKAKGDYIVQPSTLQNLQTPAWISDKKTFLGSCNGLICLSTFSQIDQTCTLYICNPLLRQFAVLPQPSHEERLRDEGYGFGYSSMTGHYKILRIFTRKWHPGKSEAQVLTIGIDNHWRTVGDDTTFPMVKKWSKNGSRAHFCDVTLHRALHWMVEDAKRPDFIYSFAIDKEEVSPIPPPPGMGERNNSTSIGVLEGCLCIFKSTCPTNLDIWWMKDYGDMNSWTKESISSNYIPVGLKNSVVVPILCWRNGEILMYAGRGCFISYSPKEKRTTEIRTELDLDEFSTAASLVPSFLPLKAITKSIHMDVAKME